MNNIPKVKVGIVAVSRDCFPESLSVNRRKALTEAYAAKYDAEDIYECPVCIVESEIHMQKALADIKAAGCNALCVFFFFFLVTSDRKFQKQCLHSSLTVPRCLLRRQRKTSAH